MSKNILQICRLTPLWGMDLYQAISQGLYAQGHSITTIFIAGSPQENLYQTYSGKVIFLESNKKQWFWQWQARRKLKKIFDEQKFDVVIAHQYQPTQMIDHLCSQYSVPQCVSVHHTSHNFRHLKRRLWLRFFSRAPWKWVGVSQATANNLKQAGCSPTHVMLNAIDVDSVQHAQLTREEARAALGIPSDAFVFGTLGRLVPEKNHMCLLKALKKVNATNVHLVILGKGPSENFLRSEAKQLGILDLVHIDCAYAQSGARFLKAFDVFLFPSLHEPFGIALLEAMVARVPIIASNTGGIPEVVGDAALQLNPLDISAWASAMQDYHQKNAADLMALGLIGYKQVLQCFSLTEYQKRWCQLVCS